MTSALANGNALSSDGTQIVNLGVLDGGTRETQRSAEKLGNPCRSDGCRQKTGVTDQWPCGITADSDTDGRAAAYGAVALGGTSFGLAFESAELNRVSGTQEIRPEFMGNGRCDCAWMGNWRGAVRR